jgi:hypothetical protein
MHFAKDQGVVQRRTMAAMVAFFIASRIVYALLGVQFIDGFTTSWQALDPELFEHDLLRSLYLLHVQPPAFNLLVGVVEKLASGHSQLVFRVVFWICGLVLYLTLFRLMSFLGVTRWLALTVSTLFIVSPAVILYENWFFYTLPLATVSTLAVLAASYFLRTKRRQHAFAFFALVALLCCLHSSFHLGYFALLIGGAVLAYPAQRKPLLTAAALPFSLVLALYLKNAVLFGSFGVSSWMGMNLARVPFANWPIEERTAEVASGNLSPVSLVEPFSALALYPARYQQIEEKGGLLDTPMLRDPLISTGGNNYNSLAYVKISKQYLDDVKYSVRHFPRYYLKGVLRSAFIYTKAASDYAWLIENRKAIHWVDEFYDRVFLGRVLIDGSGHHVRGSGGEPLRLYVSLIFGLPLVVAFGLWSSRSLERERAILLLYIAFTVMYVATVGILLESGENNRFRFTTDALSLVLFALLLERLKTAAIKRRAPKLEPAH